MFLLWVRDVEVVARIATTPRPSHINQPDAPSRYPRPSDQEDAREGVDEVPADGHRDARHLARSCAITRNIARLQPEEGMAAVVANEETGGRGFKPFSRLHPHTRSAWELRGGEAQMRDIDDQVPTPEGRHAGASTPLTSFARPIEGPAGQFGIEDCPGTAPERRDHRSRASGHGAWPCPTGSRECAPRPPPAPP
jgi:hypothetical protein